MSTDLKTFFPDPVIVQIADKEKKEVIDFEINEFVFSNRVKFIKIVSQIFSDLAKQNIDFTKMKPIEAVPVFIEVAGEKLGEIYSLVLDRPIEWIQKNITFKKEVEILTKIVEVNDIPFLVGQIKKAIQGSPQNLA
jgi:hypothetical protein